MEQQIFYRVGFRGVTPFLDRAELIGTNDTQKVTTFFLAPLDENGESLTAAIRSIQAGQDGNPNGYFKTLDEAKAAVKSQLEEQIKFMNQAIEALASFGD